jgi:catalase-peroxidase
MAMNDEETVALIAGGHTFGKAHGAANRRPVRRPRAGEAPIEEQNLGWKNSFGSGNGAATITSGLEGAWTTNPIKWDNDYFDHLFGYEWDWIKAPAAGTSGLPRTERARARSRCARSVKEARPDDVHDGHRAEKDPSYAPISKRFHENPAEFADAFARAWYKLTHRDMGPITRYLGPLVPAEPRALARSRSGRHASADRRARHRRPQGSDPRIGTLRFPTGHDRLGLGVTFRGTDKRGGANGARIRLAPQKDWEVNQPAQLATVLPGVGEDPSRTSTAAQSGGKRYRSPT